MASRGLRPVEADQQIGSAIDGLVDHGVQIGAEPACIDPGCSREDGQ